VKINQLHLTVTEPSVLLETPIIATPAIKPLPLSPSLEHLERPRALDVLHLEEIHPTISGNKWYKLKYNVSEAEKRGFNTLLSCGGPHSNHLHALACVGQALGFKTRAFVRGYEELPLTPTLEDCQRMGMSLTFVDKKTYKQRYDPLWCQQQSEKYDSYWIPEGGDNDLGHQGCTELAQYCQGYDEVWLSIGSGCTFLGLAEGIESLAETASGQRPIIQGVLAIKGGEALAADLLSQVDAQHRINSQGHLGGFGKCPASLLALIQVYDQQGLALDPVYTAKLIMALEQSWQTGMLDVSKRYLMIHSGGLQGRRGVAALSSTI
jgi:1-aminocyclopropane-1-carboxylate deaminase